MSSRSRTVHLVQSLYPLILGLILVCGLLWVLAPRAVVEAQASGPKLSLTAGLERAASSEEPIALLDHAAAITRTIVARYNMLWQDDLVVGEGAIPGNAIHITVTDSAHDVVATGTTTDGTCPWCGPDGYYLELPDGVLYPGNTVTVNWGEGFVDAVEVVSMTGYPDPSTDVVTGTAPAEGWLWAFVERVGGWDRYDIGDVEVDASGVYTLDLDSEGWDIQYGDEFHIYYAAPNDHRVEYWFWLPAPELWIEKENTPGAPVPGGTQLYRIRYGNGGNGDAENVVISDTLPLSTTYAGDSSGFSVYDMGDTVTWTLGTVPRGAEGEFYVALALSTELTAGGGLESNCATITTTTPGDPDWENNGSCSGGMEVGEGDSGLWVNKNVHPGDPHPGQRFYYEIDYGTEGPAANGPAWLTDTLPLSTTYEGGNEEYGWGALWTEVVTTGGQFVLYAPAGIPGDMGGRIRLALRLDEEVPIGTRLENRVEITAATDANPDNNWDVNDDARVSEPRYDLRTDKWFGHGAVVPGGYAAYGVQYENKGNVLTHAWLTDTLPAGTSFDRAWRWSPEGDQPVEPYAVSEEQVVFDLGFVEVGEGDIFDIRLDISPEISPETPLENCATVGPEPESKACATVTVFEAGHPNLYVDKRVDNYNPGNDWLNYQIDVRNYGDVTVEGVRITDTYPLSTTFHGNWGHNFWEGIDLVSHNEGTRELVWELDRLDPGWSTGINFSVQLQEPQERLRWYTNTVEIDVPPDEAYADDNQDVEVTFSGGEVDWVDVRVYGSRIWGDVPEGPITVTTESAWTAMEWGGRFDWDAPHPILPGQVITVEAGAGREPVVIEVPEPFDADASSIADEVWGQVDRLDGEWLEVSLDGGPSVEVQTDASGYFTATFFDVPRGGRGEVRYRTDVDYARVTFHRGFQSPDLILEVNYGNDGVDGNYPPGHTVWITVTDSDGEFKATNVVTTAAWPWWGWSTGFSTNHSPWSLE